MFNSVDETIDELDRQFYEGFDPFFFHTASESTKHGKLPTVKVSNGDGIDEHDHDILSGYRKSASSLDGIQRSMVWMFRYFGSEMMILLICSGIPHTPFIRNASIIRDRKLNSVFESISNSKIPNDFSMSIDGHELTFREWLSQKIFLDKDAFEDEDLASIEKMIVKEANFLKERCAINAFKHGRSARYGDTMKVRLSSIDGTQSMENKGMVGINWVDWEEKNRRISIMYNSEEVITEDDRNVIFQSALIMDVMKEMRIRKFNNQDNININTITKLVDTRNVLRQRFRVNMDFKQKENE